MTPSIIEGVSPTHEHAHNTSSVPALSPPHEHVQQIKYIRNIHSYIHEGFGIVYSMKLIERPITA